VKGFEGKMREIREKEKGCFLMLIYLSVLEKFDKKQLN
jgi:hypothetical protein